MERNSHSAKSICNAPLQRLRRKQRIPKIKSICPNTRVGRVGASKSHHLTLRLPCIKIVIESSMQQIQSSKKGIKHIPKLLKNFAPLFPWEKQANRNLRNETQQGSRFSRRGYTQYTQHTGLKSTHTNATRRERVRADQTPSHQPPLSPPSTDCGRREKGGENIKGIPHINGVCPKGDTQIYIPK